MGPSLHQHPYSKQHLSETNDLVHYTHTYVSDIIYGNGHTINAIDTRIVWCVTNECSKHVVRHVLLDVSSHRCRPLREWL